MPTNSINPTPYHAVLLDVEGTTTRVQFVTECLFPYAAQALSGFIGDAANTERWQPLAKQITTEAPHQPAETTVREWMAQDVKHPLLKTLQGWLWQAGYESGNIQGHVYADVPQAFADWQAAGKGIHIYSSGSVLAQQLLFGHSVAGDLRPYIGQYFDTAVGPKRDPASYHAIAQQLALAPANILFASDIAEELIAAQTAGLQVVQVQRPDHPGFIPVDNNQNTSTQIAVIPSLITPPIAVVSRTPNASTQFV
jgi:enolase-phosphatase E1